MSDLKLKTTAQLDYSLTMDQSRPADKWRVIALLSLAELLGMATWFSASAVVPTLTDEWSLGSGGRSWLTMSVQIGFVAGAFGSALLNLADRLPSRWLLAGSVGSGRSPFWPLGPPSGSPRCGACETFRKRDS